MAPPEILRALRCGLDISRFSRKLLVSHRGWAAELLPQKLCCLGSSAVEIMKEWRALCCFQKDGDAFKSIDTNTDDWTRMIAMVAALKEASNLFALHNSGTTQTMFAELDECNWLIGFMATPVPDAGVEEGVASRLVLGLHKFAENVIIGLAEVDPALAQFCKEWFMSQQSSELAGQCQSKCEEKAQPAVAECKSVVAEMFNGTTALPAAEEMSKFRDFVLKCDLPSAIAIVGALPNNTLMRMQLEFVSLYVALFKEAAITGLDRISSPLRADRKINQARHDNLIRLRLCLKALQDFLAKPKVAAEGDLFSEAANVVRMLAGPRNSMKVSFDFGHVAVTIKTIQKLITDVSTEWRRDTADLVRIIESWISVDVPWTC